MRILRLRAYYDPEKTAGIHLDHDLSEAFLENGIYYYSYTPAPSRGLPKGFKDYNRLDVLYDGHTIVKRFPMFKEGSSPFQRLFRYIACSLIEYCLGARTNGIDIVYSSSTPPTQGMLSAMVAKRLSKKYGKKVPFVFNLQDIFPDSLVNTKLTKKGSLIWKFGRLIENYTYKNADYIIVIGESFRNNLLNKGVADEKIVVIPNWVDINNVKPIPKNNNSLFDELNIPRDSFVVLYAGNMGEAQGVDVILDAAKIIGNSINIQFVLFGNGSRYHDICDRVNNESISNVIVKDLLPQDRISEVYSFGDVAIITGTRGTGNAGLPSKTWSIFACNTPIIASFDTDSELASIIERASAGICIEPENPSLLAESIINEYHINRKSKNLELRSFVVDNASKETCTKKYIEVFNEVMQ